MQFVVPMCVCVYVCVALFGVSLISCGKEKEFGLTVLAKMIPVILRSLPDKVRL